MQLMITVNLQYLKLVITKISALQEHNLLPILVLFLHQIAFQKIRIKLLMKIEQQVPLIYQQIQCKCFDLKAKETIITNMKVIELNIITSCLVKFYYHSEQTTWSFLMTIKINFHTDINNQLDNNLKTFSKIIYNRKVLQMVWQIIVEVLVFT